MGGVFGVAETLQKRLCHASDTPQKHSRSHPYLHLYVFSHRGEFHDQCARWSTPNARASAPSSFLYLSYAIVGTMAEVGVGRPTARARARALVLESTEIISQVRALIQTNL